MSKKPFVTKEQVEEIVKTYPTPFHLYDEKGIRRNAEAFVKMQKPYRRHLHGIRDIKNILQ